MEPHSLKPDRSDRKATNNLIDKLMALSKNSPGTSKSPKSRKRPLRGATQNSKITSWLRKDNQAKRQKTQNESKKKPLDITVTRLNRTPSSEKYGVEVPSFEKIRADQEKFAQHKENVNKLVNAVEKKSKSKKSLKRNSSFEKYGIAMPSFDKIVEDQKKFDMHKESVKKLDIFDDEILNKSLVIDCLEVKEFTGELLDCKHMTLRDLGEAFSVHKNKLSDIISGKKYSERHDRFHQKTQEVFLKDNLKCSASLIVFSQEQKDHLLDLMRTEFDPEDKLTTYFFKVLLPELCLLIFMDEHRMSKRKASAYLDKRPLD